MTAPTAARSATSSGRRILTPEKRRSRSTTRSSSTSPGQPSRLVHDHHVNGLFPEHTWLHLLEQAGFTARVVPGDPDDEDRVQPLFVCRRPL